MKKLTLSIALALATAVAASPAAAEKQEAPKKFKFDAKKAYVLVRTSGDMVRLERIDPKSGKFFGGATGPKKAKGEDDDAMITQRRAFVGRNGENYYLASVTPGDWVIMGNSRTCLCMGSYKFAVAAGQIVDLGLIESGREQYFPVEDGVGIPVPDDLLDRPYAIADAFVVKPSQNLDSLPPALAKLPVKIAEYETGVEFENRRGLLLSRARGLPPIIPPRKRSKEQQAGGV